MKFKSFITLATFKSKSKLSYTMENLNKNVIYQRITYPCILNAPDSIAHTVDITVGDDGMSL